MSRVAIGVDVGGTKIAAGLVTPTGEIREHRVLPTPAAEGGPAILAAIAHVATTLRARVAPSETLVGVGIGTGGVVDHRSGVIVSATGLLHDWAGSPVADHLRERLGMPVLVDNDGNALALGEHLFGAGVGLADVVYVAVGTGIGGGLVLGGRLRRGAHHTAGELGHLTAPGARARPCSCGRVGHLEAVASGPAIADDYRERTGQSPVSDLREVAALAEAGDLVATEVITEAATILGRVLAGLADTIDPEAVVLGGGVAQLGSVFWTPLTEGFLGEALPAARDTPLRPARLGPAAALVGAAMLVLTQQPDPIDPAPPKEPE